MKTLLKIVTQMNIKITLKDGNSIVMESVSEEYLEHIKKIYYSATITELSDEEIAKFYTLDSRIVLQEPEPPSFNVDGFLKSAGNDYHYQDNKKRGKDSWKTPYKYHK